MHWLPPLNCHLEEVAAATDERSAVAFRSRSAHGAQLRNASAKLDTLWQNSAQKIVLLSSQFDSRATRFPIPYSLFPSPCLPHVGVRSSRYPPTSANKISAD